MGISLAICRAALHAECADRGAVRLDSADYADRFFIKSGELINERHTHRQRIQIADAPQEIASKNSRVLE